MSKRGDLQAEIIHLVNIFEHYILHPKDFSKSGLLKAIRVLKKRYEL